MNLIHQEHQGFFFCNNSDLSPSPDVFKTLLEHFGSMGLMPNIGQELNITTGENKQFVILVNGTGNLRIEFSSMHILVVQASSTMEDFYSTFMQIIEKLSALFPFKKGNRLSIVNSKFFNGSEDQYLKLYKSLFTYKSIRPFEWENRVAEKKNLNFKESSEEVNSISTVRRGEMMSPFFNNGKLTSVIEFNIDTNTSPKNNDKRFSFKESIDLYHQIFKNNINLSQEFNRYESI